MNFSTFFRQNNLKLICSVTNYSLKYFATSKIKNQHSISASQSVISIIIIQFKNNQKKINPYAIKSAIRMKYLCILAELFLEDTDRTRATNIVCHQSININPDIVTWAQLGFLGGPGQDLLGHSHPRLDLITIKIRHQKPQTDYNAINTEVIDSLRRKRKKTNRASGSGPAF